MNALQQLNVELAGIVAKIRPHLVQIRNGRRSGGAGVIWRDDGLIVTNAHVVAASLRRRRRPTIVTADGQTHQGHFVAVSEKSDLAALRLDGAEYTAAEIGDAASLKPGDWLTAIGHPWGVVGAVTSGAVIGVGRSYSVAYPGALIQVGLHMRPGHSGGPMVDLAGRVVGINCMIAGPDVGLAIPSNSVNDFLDHAKRIVDRTTRRL